MSSEKTYLKDFIYYCKYENALREKRQENLYKITYRNEMKLLATQREDPYIKARFDKNIIKAKQLLINTSYYHNTSIACIINILEKGYLLSISEMEKQDISFNYMISFRGINEDFFKYVFAYPKGEWIYGLCEIEFIREIENIPNALFLPKSRFCLPEHEVNNHIMEFNNWKTYLQEYIATNLDNPDHYFRITPTYHRPEFLFMDKIPIEYIKKITCKGKSTFEDLSGKIKQVFGEGSPYLELVAYID